MKADPSVVERWDQAQRPITIVHANKALWNELVGRSEVQIRDAGYTEIPKGTNTTVALWQ